jgi:hypothetical protein
VLFNCKNLLLSINIYALSQGEVLGQLLHPELALAMVDFEAYHIALKDRLRDNNEC